jgi:hypothetical protein
VKYLQFKNDSLNFLMPPASGLYAKKQVKMPIWHINCCGKIFSAKIADKWQKKTSGTILASIGGEH